MESKEPMWSVPDTPKGKVLVQRALVVARKIAKDGTLVVRLNIFGENFPESMIGEEVQICQRDEE